MRNAEPLHLAMILSVVLAACGCSPTRAVTAEDFVKKHRKAHYFRDAKAVAAMTLCAEDLEKTSLPARIGLELRDFHRDSLAAGLKSDMKRDGVWAKAWEDTRYIGEEDHGYYIKVEVKVGYAYSSIVLVRVGDCLKIAPNPGSFE
jgi:hypothetical protein